MAPIAGPPQEAWKPVITEGILANADSPYEGRRDFKVDNAWQSSLRPDGTYVTVYAGDEPRGGRGIIWVQDLMAGVEVRHDEMQLPAVHPRVSMARGHVLTITALNGKRWTLDVDRASISVP